MEARFCDELDGWCLGWIATEPRFMLRASHALVHEGRVWLVDPVDAEGVEARVLSLGEPAGVIQLVDRHARDCAALATRLGVPLHEIPYAGVPGAPFDALPVRRSRRWREAALWWPDRRTLVCTEAIGTAPYFLAPGERLGVHPFLRLTPPRALASLEPSHVLCGHGEGVHDPGAAAALREAIELSRRRTPRWLLGLLRGRSLRVGEP
jgi:hypothetical protein